MELGEFRIVGEWEVEVDGLEVSPAVAFAAEDPVEAGVDIGAVVGPEFTFLVGVHPRVHGRGEELALEGFEQLVDVLDFCLEEAGQVVEFRGGAAGFELNHMEGEFIGPFDEAAGGDIRLDLAGFALDELVGDGLDMERPVMDDHVFQFDAEALEEGVGWGFHVERRPTMRASMRRWKDSMTRS